MRQYEPHVMVPHRPAQLIRKVRFVVFVHTKHLEQFVRWGNGARGDHTNYIINDVDKTRTSAPLEFININLYYKL